MKKFLLILLLSAFTLQSKAVIRPTYLDMVASKIIIHNFCNCQYDYSQFQISVNSNYYTLSSLTLAWGVLNMLAYQNACLVGLSMPPPSAADNGGGGASIAIWYPGSLPSNATPANLVAFLQYGSGGHDYEAVAVSAGMWVAGEYINVPPPIGFTGGITDYALSFYSTATGIVSVDGVEGISINPNPASEKTYLSLPDGLQNVPVKVTIYNSNGEAVLRKPFESTREIDIRNLPAGFYMVEVADQHKPLHTLRFIRN